MGGCVDEMETPGGRGLSWCLSLFSRSVTGVTLALYGSGTESLWVASFPRQWFAAGQDFIGMSPPPGLYA